MRIALAFLMLSSFAYAALDCNDNERALQFSGYIKNYQKVAVDQYIFDCFYEINIADFSTNPNCAFDVNDVYGYRFEDQSCSLKNDDYISGILVKKNNRIVIE